MKRIIAVSLLLFLTPLFLIVLGLGSIAYFATPFAIDVQGAQAKIDVSTLGEYPTSVSRIRLSERDSGKVLWELASVQRVPQIWDFTLSMGPNSVELVDAAQNHKYRVVHPTGASSFELRRRVAYRVELWNQGGWWRTSKTFSFSDDPRSR
jgi:hypothetical protein